MMETQKEEEIAILLAKYLIGMELFYSGVLIMGE
jgi:hypothetical protein